jgi:hypothetical protein
MIRPLARSVEEALRPPRHDRATGVPESHTRLIKNLPEDCCVEVPVVVDGASGHTFRHRVQSTWRDGAPWSQPAPWQPLTLLTIWHGSRGRRAASEQGERAMTRIVTGLFDKRRSVDTVVEHLVQEFGVPRERVQVHAADPASGEETRSPQDDDQELALPDLGLPEASVQAYGEGMRRGGVLLVAWVDDRHVDPALQTYREYGATDAEVCQAPGAHLADDADHAVQVRAYHLWEQEGRPEGRELEFWYRARAFEDDIASRAPQEFAGETGAASLPEGGEAPSA